MHSVRPLFSVKWKQGIMGNPNPVSENLIKQVLFFQAEKSCKCKKKKKKKKQSDAEFSSVHNMANVDQQKRMLTSLARIKHLEWSASKESRVDRSP